MKMRAVCDQCEKTVDVKTATVQDAKLFIDLDCGHILALVFAGTVTQENKPYYAKKTETSSDIG